MTMVWPASWPPTLPLWVLPCWAVPSWCHPSCHRCRGAKPLDRAHTVGVAWATLRPCRLELCSLGKQASAAPLTLVTQ